MNNAQSIAMMIGGGILLAIGLPTIFFALFMYNEFEMYLGSFTIVIGIILLKVGDNWLWAHKTLALVDRNT